LSLKEKIISDRIAFAIVEEYYNLFFASNLLIKGGWVGALSGMVDLFSRNFNE